MKHSLLLLLTVISLSASAQVYKFRATGFAFLKYNNIEADNPPWQSTDILIILNYDKEKITLFNKAGDTFDILTDPQKVVKEAGTVWTFGCLDKNQIRCDVTFLNLPKSDHEWSVTVKYSDEEYIYNMDKTD